VCMCVYVYVCVCAYAYVYVYVYVYVCMYVYMYMCMYVCMCMCVCVCVKHQKEEAAEKRAASDKRDRLKALVSPNYNPHYPYSLPRLCVWVLYG